VKFLTGSAFRQSLESYIQNRHNNTALPYERLRKIIAFDRFLARLNKAIPGMWVLKGGYMLEIYYPGRVRTTKDVDLLFLDKGKNIHELLVQAGLLDLGDWFSFEVQRPSNISHEDSVQYRFNIRSLLVSRIFESFHLDVNTSDALVSKPVFKNGMGYLEFADIHPVRIPCYSLEQQAAEKLHYLTKADQGERLSRVKDLIDILFIASNYAFSYKKLKQTIEFTFSTRSTHLLPIDAPKIESIYSRTYENLSKETGLNYRKLDDGNQAFGIFITPFLSGITGFSRWVPENWLWK
jgi:hypothetical protein